MHSKSISGLTDATQQGVQDDVITKPIIKYIITRATRQGIMTKTPIQIIIASIAK